METDNSIYADVLSRLVRNGEVRIDDLDDYDEDRRHLLKQTLDQMVDRDWLARDDRSPTWRLGPRAEMLLALGEE